MERQKSVTARRVQWRCEGEREWTKITSNKKDEKTKLEKEDGGKKKGKWCTQIERRKWLLSYFAWEKYGPAEVVGVKGMIKLAE